MGCCQIFIEIVALDSVGLWDSVLQLGLLSYCTFSIFQTYKNTTFRLDLMQTALGPIEWANLNRWTPKPTQLPVYKYQKLGFRKNYNKNYGRRVDKNRNKRNSICCLLYGFRIPLGTFVAQEFSSETEDKIDAVEDYQQPFAVNW